MKRKHMKYCSFIGLLLVVCFLLSKMQTSKSMPTGKPLHTESVKIESTNEDSKVETESRAQDGPEEEAEKLPRVKDAIADKEKVTALCIDGSVWSWGRGQERKSAVRVGGLENIKKIMSVGPAMYALSEDGHVYVWGSNRWHQVESEGEREEYFETARKVPGLADIADMEASVDADCVKARAFAIDRTGNLYIWGLYIFHDEDKDDIPKLINEERKTGEGVISAFAGAGHNHYFIREDGTVFSITDDTLIPLKNEGIHDCIFPVFPIEESETEQKEQLTLRDIPYVDLREGTGTGFTIMCELGSDETVSCMDTDKYTMFAAREDGSLWYWNSKMILYHDCKDAITDLESHWADYSGNWEAVTAGEITGMAAGDGEDLAVTDICAGCENVFFLTESGEVFMSEYVTCGVKDIEYWHVVGDPMWDGPETARDLELKKLSFRRLGWKNIASINTDGTYYFTAVDEDGECFYVDMPP